MSGVALRKYWEWFRRNRQVLAFCALLLTIAWGVFYWQMEQDRRNTVAAARDNINQLTLAFEDYVRLAVHSIDNVLWMAKREYEDEGQVPSIVKDSLLRLLDNPNVNNCSIIGADGYPVFSTLPPLGKIYVGDMPHFTQHLAADTGGPYISPPQVGRLSGKLSIFISRRLNNADGSFAGVITINVKPEYFTKFFRDVQLEEGGIVRIVGLDGIVRASQYSGSDAEIGHNMKPSALFEQLAVSLAGGQYYSRGRLFGIPRYLAYSTLTDYSLVVQVGKSEAQILAPFETRRRAYFTMAAAISLFILLFSGLLLRTAEHRHQAVQRYRALMDQAFEAIAIVDPKTHEILEFNPRFSEMLGYTAADRPLKTYRILGISREEADRVIAEITADGCIPPTIRSAVAKDGRIFPVERALGNIVIGARNYCLLIMRNLSKERLLEKEIAADAALAHRIQEALLPRIAPSPCVDVRTYSRPLRLVSGDTLGLKWDAAGTVLTGYLIDVAGHGLATALQTAALGVLLRQATELSLPLADQLAWLNDRIPQYFEEESFAAAIMFELDTAKSELRYAGGGITEFYRGGERVPVPGYLLGLSPTADYREISLPVRPGDVFCFLTDGLGEIIRGQFALTGKNAAEIAAFFASAAVTEKLFDDASAIWLEIKAADTEDGS